MSTKRLCVKKGKHAFGWHWPKFIKSEYNCRWRFENSMQYTLPGEDQKDWNKLCGLSMHLWTNHQDSVMIAWRWIPEKEHFEIAPYLHVNGKTYYHEKQPNNLPIVEMAQIQDLETRIRVIPGKVEIEIQVADIIQPYSIKMATWNTRLRVINPWFGGNSRAPHRMCLKRKILKTY